MNILKHKIHLSFKIKRNCCFPVTFLNLSLPDIDAIYASFIFLWKFTRLNEEINQRLNQIKQIANFFRSWKDKMYILKKSGNLRRKFDFIFLWYYFHYIILFEFLSVALKKNTPLIFNEMLSFYSDLKSVNIKNK